MKTVKLIIGIISIALFGVIFFQSCAVGIGHAFQGNGETSSNAGFILAICILIAGIAGAITRKTVIGGYISGGIYAAGGIIGIVNHGSYTALIFWSVLSLVFAAVFIVGSIMTRRRGAETKQDSETLK